MLPTSRPETPLTHLQPDMFDELASEMALVHNAILRGLNSIYLQAPHIVPADEKSFVSYIRSWYHTLHTHHKGEETDMFPAIEELAGEPGIMATNRDQHHAFEGAVDRLKKYIDAVEQGKEKYSGAKVVELVDSFGEILVQHLEDEIQTLLGLRKYGEAKMAKLMQVVAEEAQKGMKEVGTAGLVWVWANIDLEFEDGRWTDWPPAPAPVKFVVSQVLWRMYGGMAKFGAVDRRGKMRPLYALSKGAENEKQ
jgi:hemerythrin-like domain-containing protein